MVLSCPNTITVIETLKCSLTTNPLYRIKTAYIYFSDSEFIVYNTNFSLSNKFLFERNFTNIGLYLLNLTVFGKTVNTTLFKINVNRKLV